MWWAWDVLPSNPALSNQEVVVGAMNDQCLAYWFAFIDELGFLVLSFLFKKHRWKVWFIPIGLQQSFSMENTPKAAAAILLQLNLHKFTDRQVSFTTFPVWFDAICGPLQQFPDSWLRAMVIPGKIPLANNYELISVMPILCNILARIICGSIATYLHRN